MRPRLEAVRDRPGERSRFYLIVFLSLWDPTAPALVFSAFPFWDDKVEWLSFSFFSLAFLCAMAALPFAGRETEYAGDAELQVGSCSVLSTRLCMQR